MKILTNHFAVAAISVVLFAYIPNPASAQGISSAKLTAACELALRNEAGEKLTLKQRLDAETCLPYISGFFDALTLSVVAAGAKESVCLPKSGVSYEQAARVYLKYMRDNPEDQDKATRHNLFIALLMAYPC